MTDALGNPIVIGNWYGYSRNDGGFSHTTLGKAKHVKPGDGRYTVSKVRLVECQVSRRLYGQPYDGEPGAQVKKPSDVSMDCYMVFPIPSQK